MPGTFEPLLTKGDGRQYALARLFTRFCAGLDRPHKLNILARLETKLLPGFS